MANDPTYVDAGEGPGNGCVHYHYGLDFGVAKGLVDVMAATDGIVASAGTDVLTGVPDTPIAPPYDAAYLRNAPDARHTLRP